MDDAEYIYKQDVKEKAITARSSHKYGSSRRRRCGLSSDNLTRKEWERMNGQYILSSPTRLFPGTGSELCRGACSRTISSISSRSLRSGPQRSVVCSVSARPIAGTTSKSSSVSLSRDARPDRRPCASSTPIDPTEDRFAPTKKHRAHASLADLLRRLFARGYRRKVTRSFPYGCGGLGYGRYFCC